MKYWIAITFLFLLKQVSAQMPVKVVEIDSAEKVVEMDFQTMDRWGIHSRNEKTNAEYIYTKKGKYGPFHNAEVYSDYAVLPDPAGQSIFFNGKVYGPYDSISADGVLKYEKGFLAFEIFEKGKSYIVNGQTNEKYGPFEKSYFEILDFSSDGKQLFFYKSDNDSQSLYLNRTLVYIQANDCNGIRHFGFDKADSFYCHLADSTHEWIYYKGKVKSYPLSDGYYFYFDPIHKEYVLKRCHFEGGGYGDDKFVGMDSKYYLFSNQVFSGPFNYVEKSIQYQGNKGLFSFVTLDRGKYFLHLDDKVFGPFKEKPEMVFNRFENSTVKEQWAFKAKKKKGYYLFSNARAYGPFKYVSKPVFSVSNGLMYYRAVNKKKEAFIYYGEKKYPCVTGEGEFILSEDGRYMVFCFSREKRLLLGVNDKLFDSIPVGQYGFGSIRHKFLPETGEFITVWWEGDGMCLRLNDRIHVCNPEIKCVGVSKKGSLYYALKENEQFYFYINRKRLGPYDGICGITDRQGCDNLHANRDMIQAYRNDSTYLIFEDRVFGPFPERINIQGKVELSDDGQRLVFEHYHQPSPDAYQRYLSTSEDPYKPIPFFGDFKLTAKGLCYYLKDVNDSVFLMLEGQKIIIENYIRGSGYLRDALIYNWQHDILSYALIGKDGFPERLFRIKEKTYVGQFVRHSQSEFIYLDGKKLMYLKL